MSSVSFHCALTDVPAPLTPLIGRAREIARAREFLARGPVRLLTMTGPGGVGKTRLALAIADEVAAAFPDGIAFVPLASLRDPMLVLPEITRVLGGRDTAGRSLDDRLHDLIGAKQLLLLLDNVEQVTPVAPALVELLVACPGLRIVVTSRVPLRVRGEYLLPVPPLPTPDLRCLPAVNDLARNEAVALLVHRAVAADPGFSLTMANAAALAEVCVRLDGLPLAIELAAARLQVLSPAALLARLTDRLALLTRGTLDLPERQQTLRAAIAWSDDLLTPADRTLFRRLAVFAGGCEAAAAEQVGGGESPSARPDDTRIEPTDSPSDTVATLDALADLLDHGLLRREVINGVPRFGMLETIREYALDALEASGEAAVVRARHAAYFVAFAEAAEPALYSYDQVAALDRLEADHDNLRAALAWTLAHNPGVALQLAGALAQFWYLRGHFAEGQRWLDHVLGAESGSPAARLKAITGATQLAAVRGERERNRRLAEDGVALARAIGDQRAEALALIQLDMACDGQEEYLHEALALARHIEDSWLLAHILNNLGMHALFRGETERARQLIEEAVAIDRRAGDPFSSAAHLLSLGDIARERGDIPGALAAYGESVHIAHPLNFQELVAESVRGVASAAARQCPDHRIARLLGAAEALRETIGLVLHAEDEPAYEGMVTMVRDHLGEPGFVTAWAAGRALSREEAIAETLAVASLPMPGTTSEPGTADALSGLTPREAEVLALLARGRSDREIARDLFISPHTASTHVKRLLRKLDVPSRAAAANWAGRHGVI